MKCVQRKHLGVVQPINGALVHVGEGATCHPLNVDGLNLHALQRADDREVGVVSDMLRGSPAARVWRDCLIRVSRTSTLKVAKWGKMDANCG